MWLVRTSVMVCVPQCASREGGSPRLPILRTPPFFCAWTAPVQPPTARTTATSPTAIARLPPMGTLPVCSHHREKRHACRRPRRRDARGTHGRAAPHERQGGWPAGAGGQLSPVLQHGKAMAESRPDVLCQDEMNEPTGLVEVLLLPK